MKAGLLSILLFVSTPPEAEADAPDTETQAPADEPEPQLEAARALFLDGVARYSAADYEGAIESWVKAYTDVPARYEYRQVRAELVYNIATAHGKWFDIDQDIKHLRSARRSLENFIQEIPAIYSEAEVALEQTKAQRLLDDLDRRIKAAEDEARLAEQARLAALRPKFDAVADARERKRNRGLIAAGATLSGLAVASAGIVAAGGIMARRAEDEVGGLETEAELPARQDQIQRGNTGNTLMVVGTVVGAISVVAGALVRIAALTGHLAEARRLMAVLPERGNAWDDPTNRSSWGNAPRATRLVDALVLALEGEWELARLRLEWAMESNPVFLTERDRALYERLAYAASKAGVDIRWPVPTRDPKAKIWASAVWPKT